MRRAESRQCSRRAVQITSRREYLCSLTHILCWQNANHVSGPAMPFSALRETAVGPHLDSASCLHSSLSCIHAHPLVYSSPASIHPAAWHLPLGGIHTLPRSRRALHVETTDIKSEISRNANIRSVASIGSASSEAAPAPCIFVGQWITAPFHHHAVICAHCSVLTRDQMSYREHLFYAKQIAQQGARLCFACVSSQHASRVLSSGLTAV